MRYLLVILYMIGINFSIIQGVDHKINQESREIFKNIKNFRLTWKEKKPSSCQDWTAFKRGLNQQGQSRREAEKYLATLLDLSRSENTGQRFWSLGPGINPLRLPETEILLSQLRLRCLLDLKHQRRRRRRRNVAEESKITNPVKHEKPKMRAFGEFTDEFFNFTEFIRFPDNYNQLAEATLDDLPEYRIPKFKYHLSCYNIEELLPKLDPKEDESQISALEDFSEQDLKCYQLWRQNHWKEPNKPYNMDGTEFPMESLIYDYNKNMAQMSTSQLCRKVVFEGDTLTLPQYFRILSCLIYYSRETLKNINKRIIPVTENYPTTNTTVEIDQNSQNSTKCIKQIDSQNSNDSEITNSSLSSLTKVKCLKYTNRESVKCVCHYLKKHPCIQLTYKGLNIRNDKVHQFLRLYNKMYERVWKLDGNMYTLKELKNTLEKENSIEFNGRVIQNPKKMVAFNVEEWKKLMRELMKNRSKRQLLNGVKCEINGGGKSGGLFHWMCTNSWKPKSRCKKHIPFTYLKEISENSADMFSDKNDYKLRAFEFNFDILPLNVIENRIKHLPGNRLVHFENHNITTKALKNVINNFILPRWKFENQIYTLDELQDQISCLEDIFPSKSPGWLFEGRLRTLAEVKKEINHMKSNFLQKQGKKLKKRIVEEDSGLARYNFNGVNVTLKGIENIIKSNPAPAAIFEDEPVKTAILKSILEGIFHEGRHRTRKKNKLQLPDFTETFKFDKEKMPLRMILISLERHCDETKQFEKQNIEGCELKFIISKILAKEKKRYHFEHKIKNTSDGEQLYSFNGEFKTIKAIRRELRKHLKDKVEFEGAEMNVDQVRFVLDVFLEPRWHLDSGLYTFEELKQHFEQLKKHPRKYLFEGETKSLEDIKEYIQSLEYLKNHLMARDRLRPDVNVTFLLNGNPLHLKDLFLYIDRLPHYLKNVTFENKTTNVEDLKFTLFTLFRLNSNRKNENLTTVLKRISSGDCYYVFNKKPMLLSEIQNLPAASFRRKTKFNEVTIDGKILKKILDKLFHFNIKELDQLISGSDLGKGKFIRSELWVPDFEKRFTFNGKQLTLDDIFSELEIERGKVTFEGQLVESEQLEIVIDIIINSREFKSLDNLKQVKEKNKPPMKFLFEGGLSTLHEIYKYLPKMKNKPQVNLENELVDTNLLKVILEKLFSKEEPETTTSLWKITTPTFNSTVTNPNQKNAPTTSMPELENERFDLDGEMVPLEQLKENLKKKNHQIVMFEGIPVRADNILKDLEAEEFNRKRTEPLEEIHEFNGEFLPMDEVLNELRQMEGDTRVELDGKPYDAERLLNNLEQRSTTTTITTTTTSEHSREFNLNGEMLPLDEIKKRIQPKGKEIVNFDGKPISADKLNAILTKTAITNPINFESTEISEELNHEFETMPSLKENSLSGISKEEKYDLNGEMLTMKEIKEKIKTLGNQTVKVEGKPMQADILLDLIEDFLNNATSTISSSTTKSIPDEIKTTKPINFQSTEISEKVNPKYETTPLLEDNRSITEMPKEARYDLNGEMLTMKEIKEKIKTLGNQTVYIEGEPMQADILLDMIEDYLNNGTSTISSLSTSTRQSITRNNKEKEITTSPKLENPTTKTLNLNDKFEFESKLENIGTILEKLGPGPTGNVTFEGSVIDAKLLKEFLENYLREESGTETKPTTEQVALENNSKDLEELRKIKNNHPHKSDRVTVVTSEKTTTLAVDIREESIPTISSEIIINADGRIDTKKLKEFVDNEKVVTTEKVNKTTSEKVSTPASKAIYEFNGKATDVDTILKTLDENPEGNVTFEGAQINARILKEFLENEITTPMRITTTATEYLGKKEKEKEPRTSANPNEIKMEKIQTTTKVSTPASKAIYEFNGKATDVDTILKTLDENPEGNVTFEGAQINARILKEFLENEITTPMRITTTATEYLGKKEKEKEPRTSANPNEIKMEKIQTTTKVSTPASKAIYEFNGKATDVDTILKTLDENPEGNVTFEGAQINARILKEFLENEITTPMRITTTATEDLGKKEKEKEPRTSANPNEIKMEKIQTTTKESTPASKAIYEFNGKATDVDTILKTLDENPEGNVTFEGAQINARILKEFLENEITTPMRITTTATEDLGKKEKEKEPRTSANPYEIKREKIQTTTKWNNFQTTKRSQNTITKISENDILYEFNGLNADLETIDNLLDTIAPEENVTFEGEMFHARDLKQFLEEKLKLKNEGRIFTTEEVKGKFNFNGTRKDKETILQLLGENPSGNVTFEGEIVSAKALKDFLKNGNTDFSTTPLVHQFSIPHKILFEFNGTKSTLEDITRVLEKNPNGNVTFEGDILPAETLKDFLAFSTSSTSQTSHVSSTTSQVRVEQTFDFNGANRTIEDILIALNENPKENVTFEGKNFPAKDIKEFLELQLQVTPLSTGVASTWNLNGKELTLNELEKEIEQLERNKTDIDYPITFNDNPITFRELEKTFRKLIEAYPSEYSTKKNPTQADIILDLIEDYLNNGTTTISSSTTKIIPDEIKTTKPINFQSTEISEKLNPKYGTTPSLEENHSITEMPKEARYDLNGEMLTMKEIKEKIKTLGNQTVYVEGKPTQADILLDLIEDYLNNGTSTISSLSTSTQPSITRNNKEKEITTSPKLENPTTKTLNLNDKFEFESKLENIGTILEKLGPGPTGNVTFEGSVIDAKLLKEFLENYLREESGTETKPTTEQVALENNSKDLEELRKIKNNHPHKSDRVTVVTSEKTTTLAVDIREESIPTISSEIIINADGRIDTKKLKKFMDNEKVVTTEKVNKTTSEKVSTPASKAIYEFNGKATDVDTILKTLDENPEGNVTFEGAQINARILKEFLENEITTPMRITTTATEYLGKKEKEKEPRTSANPNEIKMEKIQTTTKVSTPASKAIYEFNGKATDVDTILKTLDENPEGNVTFEGAQINARILKEFLENEITTPMRITTTATEDLGKKEKEKEPRTSANPYEIKREKIQTTTKWNNFQTTKGSQNTITKISENDILYEFNGLNADLETIDNLLDTIAPEENVTFEGEMFHARDLKQFLEEKLKLKNEGRIFTTEEFKGKFNFNGTRKDKETILQLLGENPSGNVTFEGEIVSAKALKDFLKNGNTDFSTTPLVHQFSIPHKILFEFNGTKSTLEDITWVLEKNPNGNVTFKGDILPSETLKDFLSLSTSPTSHVSSTTSQVRVEQTFDFNGANRTIEDILIALNENPKENVTFEGKNFPAKDIKEFLELQLQVTPLSTGVASTWNLNGKELTLNELEKEIEQLERNKTDINYPITFNDNPITFWELEKTFRKLIEAYPSEYSTTKNPTTTTNEIYKKISTRFSIDQKSSTEADFLMRISSKTEKNELTTKVKYEDAVLTSNSTPLENFEFDFNGIKSNITTILNRLQTTPTDANVTFEGEAFNAGDLRDFIIQRFGQISTTTTMGLTKTTSLWNGENTTEQKSKIGLQHTTNTFEKISTVEHIENEMKFNFNGKEMNFSTILDELGVDPHGNVSFEGENVGAKELKNFILDKLKLITSTTTIFGHPTTSKIGEHLTEELTTLTRDYLQLTTLIPKFLGNPSKQQENEMKFDFNGKEANYSTILNLLGDNPQGNVSFEGKNFGAKELRDFILDRLEKTLSTTTKFNIGQPTTTILVSKEQITEETLDKFKNILQLTTLNNKFSDNTSKESENEMKFNFNGKETNYSTILNELGNNPQGNVSFEGQNVGAKELKDFILDRVEKISSTTTKFNIGHPTTGTSSEEKFKIVTQFTTSKAFDEISLGGNVENEMKFNFNGKEANYSTILNELGDNPQGDVTFEGEKISAKELKTFLNERIQRTTATNNHLGTFSTANPFKITSMINDKTLTTAIKTTLGNFLQQPSTLIPGNIEEMKFDFNGEKANYSRILQLLGENPQGNVLFEGGTVNAKELKKFIVESLHRTTLEPLETEKKKLFQTTTFSMEETLTVEENENVLEFDFNGKKSNYSTILDALGTNPEGDVVFEGEIINAKELKDFIEKSIHPNLKTSTTSSTIPISHPKSGFTEKATSAFIVINLDSNKEESIYLPAFPQTYTTTLGNVSITVEVKTIDSGVGVTEIPKENGTVLVLTHGKESFMFHPPREEDSTNRANLIDSLRNPFIKKNHTTMTNHINIRIGNNHSIALLVEPQTYQMIYGNFSIIVVISSLPQGNIPTSKYNDIETEEITTQSQNIGEISTPSLTMTTTAHPSIDVHQNKTTNHFLTTTTTTIPTTTSILELENLINKLNQSGGENDLGPPKTFQTYPPVNVPGGSEIPGMTLITHHPTDVNVGFNVSASTSTRHTTPLSFTSETSTKKSENGKAFCSDEDISCIVNLWPCVEEMRVMALELPLLDFLHALDEFTCNKYLEIVPEILLTDNTEKSLQEESVRYNESEKQRKRRRKRHRRGEKRRSLVVDKEVSSGMKINGNLIQSTDLDLFVLLGTEVSMSCIPREREEEFTEDQFEVHWEHVDGTPTTDSRFAETPDGHLLITDVGLRDNGKYNCRVDYNKSGFSEPLQETFHHSLTVVKIPKSFEKGDQSYKPKITCNKTDHLLWATLVQPVVADRLCGKPNLCLLKLIDAKCTKNNKPLSNPFEMNMPVGAQTALEFYVKFLVEISHVFIWLPSLKTLCNLECQKRIEMKFLALLGINTIKLFQTPVPCPVETFSLEGSTTCTSCPRGWYQPEIASTACLPCPHPFAGPNCIFMFDDRYTKTFYTIIFGLMISLIVICACFIFFFRKTSDENDLENSRLLPEKKSSIRNRRPSRNFDSRNKFADEEEPFLKEHKNSRTFSKYAPPKPPPVDF